MRDNTIEEIKSRSNIVDVIGRVVNLKKAGNNYKGVCPFHNEKTPSFVVSEPKQIFTCFGCGATGDVISFVEKYYNLTFVQAKEKLAEELGITIENNYGDSKDKEELYNINREAAKFFYKGLRTPNNVGLDYMIKRGITKETLQTFGIGFADESWDSLYKYLKKLGYKEEKLLELGLISHSKGKYYDKFRNRVIFPIQNTMGKVIGFGGRALGDDMPKYLNSQETPVFLKKNNLYGLNITRGEIKNKDQGILVEGYMDVISLYQYGVRNVSASLGTALTESQGNMLKRYTKNIVLSYDSDGAGQVAALRGMDILHKQGCRVKVLSVSDGKDPDDFVKKNGRDAFLKLIDKALPFADYKFFVMKKEHDMSTTEGRIDFIEGAVKILHSLTPVEADMYIKKLASENNISEGAIRAQYNQEEEPEVRKHEPHLKEENNNKVHVLEKSLIKVLLTEHIYLEKDIGKLFKSQLGREIYSQLYKMHIESSHIDINKIYDNLDEAGLRELKDIEDNIALSGRINEVFSDCIQKIQVEELKEKEKVIIAKLSMADEEENAQEIKKLTEELIDTQKRIQLGGEIS